MTITNVESCVMRILFLFSDLIWLALRLARLVFGNPRLQDNDLLCAQLDRDTYTQSFVNADLTRAFFSGAHFQKVIIT